MTTDPSLGFKHAFVTGATGIVGVPLCRTLAAAGVKVTAYSRTGGEFGFPESIDHHQGDILDKGSLCAAAVGVDVIFHVAGAVHGSATSYAEFEQMNVEGTRNVIEAARSSGAKLIHVSSVNVAGFRNGDLTDAYAETKSRAEELVAEAVAARLEAVVVRTAPVFGNEPGGSGLLVDRLLAGSLKILPASSRKFSPVWSGDLAKALIGAAYSGEIGRTYTVAGATVSIGEFVESICESGGFRKPYVSLPGWIFAIPLQLAWWSKDVTRWTPPVRVQSLLMESSYDGSEAARELEFEYSEIEDIFG